jgi:hypothetical protein
MNAERTVSPPIENAGPVVTLAFFLEVMASRVNRLQEAEIRPIRVRGIPVRPNAPKVYADGQVYSGSVKDPRTRAIIDARYPSGLLDQVEWGTEAVIVGTVVYRLDPQGVIRPLLKVDSVEQVSSGVKVASKADLLDRWGAAITRAKRDAAASLAVDRPVVAVVTGGGSVALDDVLAQLGSVTDEVELRRVDVPMTAPEAVANAVRGLADVHLVVITRGGGTAVHDLDHEALLEAVAGAAIPVAVAAGHETDRLILGRVADVSFPTPTAFGAWLRIQLENRRQVKAQEEAVREVGRTRDLVREVNELGAKNVVLQKQVDGLGTELVKLRSAQVDGETNLKVLTAKTATLEGRNESLGRELSQLQEARKGLESLAVTRQGQAVEAEARRKALQDELNQVRASRDEYKSEWKAARKQLDEVRPASVPAIYRAAPWMLGGAAVALVVAFLLLLIRFVR